jgi:hypothetical protein
VGGTCGEHGKLGTISCLLIAIKNNVTIGYLEDEGIE